MLKEALIKSLPVQATGLSRAVLLTIDVALAAEEWLATYSEIPYSGRVKAWIFALMLLLASRPCLGQVSPDEEQIRSLRAASNRAILASDVAAFAKSLETSFTVIVGNGSSLSREAYLAAFAQDFKDPHSVRFERIVDLIELSNSLPLAAEHGHWVGRIDGGAAIFRGTYLAMWRKSDADWKLRSELFVSLDCGNAATCEAYRKRYAASLAK